MALSRKSSAAGRFSSMRPDGRIVVDVNGLLSSERVRKDLETLRQKIDAASAHRENKKTHPFDED